MNSMSNNLRHEIDSRVENYNHSNYVIKVLHAVLVIGVIFCNTFDININRVISRPRILGLISVLVKACLHVILLTILKRKRKKTNDEM